MLDAALERIRKFASTHHAQKSVNSKYIFEEFSNLAESYDFDSAMFSAAKSVHFSISEFYHSEKFVEYEISFGLIKKTLRFDKYEPDCLKAVYDLLFPLIKDETIFAQLAPNFTLLYGYFR